MHDELIFVEQKRTDHSVILSGRNTLVAAIYSLAAAILAISGLLTFSYPPGVTFLLLIVTTVIMLLGSWRWLSLRRSLEINLASAELRLRGRDWGALRDKTMPLKGRLQIKNCSGGYDNAVKGRFVMLLQLEDGTDFRLGLHSFGAFNRNKLASYARELQSLSPEHLYFC